MVWEFLQKQTFGRVPFKWDPQQLRECSSRGCLVFVTLDFDWLDRLVLNYHLKKEGLPIVKWSNALPSFFSLGIIQGTLRFVRFALWFFSFKLISRPPRRRKEAWLSSVLNKEPVVLSFPENEKRSPRLGPRSEQWLAQLLSACQKSNQPVQLVPFYLYWKRSGIEKRRTLKAVILGSPHNPRVGRKLLQFFRPYPQFSFATLAPHSLDPEVLLAPSEFDVLAKQWRRRCIIDLVAARRVLLGPSERQSDYLLDSLFSDYETHKIFVEMAEKQGVKLPDIAPLVQKYFNEIAAKVNFYVIEMTSVFMTWLFKKLFREIETIPEELEKLRELNLKGSLILIPCHKSHIDYLMLSWILFQAGMVPPHIAAGVNLAFWPFGSFGRRCGAFFIRRSFKGDYLYAEVLRQYVASLLKDRHNIEFFIEGGRSRTGRMLGPRYGILKMVFNAYQDKNLTDASVVPVFIGYDEIIEASSYKRELGGAEKKSESGMSLLGAARYIVKTFGKVYVRFGEPMSVKGLLEEYEKKDPDLVLEQTAFRISREILNESVVTPGSLLGLTYLCSGWRGVHRDQWVQSCIEHLQYFKTLGADIDLDLNRHPQGRLEDAIDQFHREKIISNLPSSRKMVFVKRRGRLDLNIYKNHLAHWAVIDASLLLAKNLPDRDFRDTALKLRSLLRFEFFLHPTSVWEDRISKFKSGEISKNVEQTLGFVYGDILEAYRMCLRVIAKKSEGTFFEDEYLRFFKTEGEKKLRAVQALRFPEGAVTANYSSCLKWLVHDGVLEKEEKRKKFIYRVKDGKELANWSALLDSILSLQFSQYQNDLH